MAVLDGFMAIWSRARATFGDGPPQDGAPFDSSTTLLEFQAEIVGATPGDHWQGPGSDTYAAANERQSRVLGDAAALDLRLRAEVDRSAVTVAAGRRDLDDVRQWVVDAAAQVPQTPQGERMLYPVVSRGSAEIAEIVQRSHSDLSSIAGRIEALGTEYQALGTDLKLGTGEGGETEDGQSERAR